MTIYTIEMIKMIGKDYLKHKLMLMSHIGIIHFRYITHTHHTTPHIYVRRSQLRTYLGSFT
jgi:hypothetical protein